MYRVCISLWWVWPPQAQSPHCHCVECNQHNEIIADLLPGEREREREREREGGEGGREGGGEASHKCSN